VNCLQILLNYDNLNKINMQTQELKIAITGAAGNLA
jgi:hypothetical protein